MMSDEEGKRLDFELLEAYNKTFGHMDTFGMPDAMPAERLHYLMRKALKEGVEIDYEKEGWYIPEGDELL